MPNPPDLSHLVNAVPGFIWSAGANGEVNFINQRWCDYTGMTQQQASGHGWTASLHPEDAEGLLHYWVALMQEGTAGEYEARLRRQDGVYRWFLIRAVPQHDEHGTVVGWYGENTDIEGRKQAEEALDKVRSEMAHLARVASLGALTASIAHEVNQPLAGIVTNAGTCLRMLAADPPNVEGAMETARRTLRDGNRAADVIKRLHALFARHSVMAEAVDVNEAAHEVVTLLLGELRRNGVVLQVQFAKDLPAIKGDRVQLQQVILNLILNAVEAMREVPGALRQLRISTTLEPRQCVQLAVRDSGAGFDATAVGRLFDAFYTTKPNGMGMGLSISRSIIEHHQGELWATLNDGPGATFHFCIPLPDLLWE
ncbi:PAS domain-containing protein [Pantoea sp. Tr-811]|uniref:PAS domain-containing sensor histidine kinase n=1 Tax=Pantoea sp. Tr-811 TaxID=2608361 RepID=UPI00141F3565|nr:ATP-binding protein [Pantoea sp. Tr-811]NIF29054.1 PAS domain-containing protein [Pantoea sp. Tr-811]